MSTIENSQHDFEGKTFQRNNRIIITLEFSQFLNRNYFISFIEQRLTPNVSYFTLIKICHHDNEYLMAGKQFNFEYFENYKSIMDLYENINSRLQVLFEEYELSESDIFTIQILFGSFNTRLLTDIRLLPEYNIKSESLEFKKSINFFPISEDISSLGTILSETFKADFIKQIHIKNPSLDKESIIFNPASLFVLRDFVSPKYVLVINNTNPELVSKEAYNIQGVFLSKVLDVKFSNGELERRTPHFVSFFDKNKNLVSKTKTNLRIQPIPLEHKKNPSITENRCY